MFYNKFIENPIAVEKYVSNHMDLSNMVHKGYDSGLGVIMMQKYNLVGVDYLQLVSRDLNNGVNLYLESTAVQSKMPSKLEDLSIEIGSAYKVKTQSNTREFKTMKFTGIQLFEDKIPIPSSSSSSSSLDPTSSSSSSESDRPHRKDDGF